MDTIFWVVVAGHVAGLAMVLSSLTTMLSSCDIVDDMGLRSCMRIVMDVNLILCIVGIAVTGLMAVVFCLVSLLGVFFCDRAGRQNRGGSVFISLSLGAICIATVFVIINRIEMLSEVDAQYTHCVHCYGTTNSNVAWGGTAVIMAPPLLYFLDRRTRDE